MPWIRGVVEGIPNPGTRWRWVVITTPQPFWSREKSTSYPLNRVLGTSYCWESKHGSSVVQSVAGSLPNELLRLVEWRITNDKRGRMWITLPVHVSRWSDEEPKENSGRTGSILAENSKLGIRIRQEFSSVDRNIFFSAKVATALKNFSKVHFDASVCDETRLIPRRTVRLKPMQAQTNNSCFS